MSAVWKTLLAAFAAQQQGGVAVPCTEGAACGAEEDEASLLQVNSEAVREQMRTDDAVLAGSAEATSPWGPLSRLIGTWESEKGINSMSLPFASLKDPSGFLVLVNNYRETLTFKPIMGKVLNRGYRNADQSNARTMENQTLMGLTYYLEIHDLDTGDLIHVEDGQWLWNYEPGVDKSWEVTRIGIIPHGSVVTAPGTFTEVTGNEVLCMQNAMVENPQEKWTIAPRSNLGRISSGYFEGQLSIACPCRGACPCDLGNNETGACPSESTCNNPVQQLMSDIGPLNDMKAVQFQTSTLHPGGSLTMLPGIKEQVFNSMFNATFWVQSPTGGDRDEDFTQLQYAQTVSMAFKCMQTLDNSIETPCQEPEDLVMWPHVQTNTLTKKPLSKKKETELDTPLLELPYIR